MTRFLLLPPLLLLAACQSQLEVEAIAGRTIMITNRSDGDIRIERVIANDQDGRAECVQSPTALLGPGRSHTLTFFDCGIVTELDVETDQGTIELDVEEAAAAR